MVAGTPRRIDDGELSLIHVGYHDIDAAPNLIYIMPENGMVVLAFNREYHDPDHKGETYTTTWFDMSRIEDGKIAEHWIMGQNKRNVKR